MKLDEMNEERSEAQDKAEKLEIVLTAVKKNTRKGRHHFIKRLYSLETKPTLSSCSPEVGFILFLN